MTLLALVVSALTLLNTLLAAVVERTNEFCVMRAIGASRWQIFHLITTESILLTLLSVFCGLMLARFCGPSLESLAKNFLPLAPTESLLAFGWSTALKCFALSLTAGFLAAFYPAWQASRLPPAAALKLE